MLVKAYPLNDMSSLFYLNIYLIFISVSAFDLTFHHLCSHHRL
ncbi:hypothetical protein C7379_1421, partial [Hallella colorans]